MRPLIGHRKGTSPFVAVSSPPPYYEGGLLLFPKYDLSMKTHVVAHPQRTSTVSITKMLVATMFGVISWRRFITEVNIINASNSANLRAGAATQPTTHS